MQNGAILTKIEYLYSNKYNKDISQTTFWIKKSQNLVCLKMLAH